MKKLLPLILCICFLKTYSQNFDSVRIVKLIKKENFVFLGSAALVSAPSLLFYYRLDKRDYYGKVLYGSFSLMSISFALGSLYNLDSPNFVSHCLFAFSGVTDAFGQELLFHYANVKEKLPFLSDKYFDPSTSWKNKYCSKIPLSTTLLVGVTDGYHLSRSINKICVVSGFITLDNKKNIKKQIKNILISSVIYTFFKGSTHYIINH